MFFDHWSPECPAETLNLYQAVYAKARKDALRLPEASRSFERFLYRKCRCSYCIEDTPRKRYLPCAWKLAEETAEPALEDIYDLSVDEVGVASVSTSSPGGHACVIVSLLDIARPAKLQRKGKTKGRHQSIYGACSTTRSTILIYFL